MHKAHYDGCLVLDLIEYFSKGNVADFSRLIKIGHQNLNRIFNIDSRSGNYPSVSSDIISAIVKYIPDVNIDWVLTGSGDMLKSESVESNAPPGTVFIADDKNRVRENFVKIIEELQKSGFIENISDFAQKTGVRQSNLSAMMSGGRSVSETMLRGLFNAFPMVNKDYVYDGNGEMLKGNYSCENQIDESYDISDGLPLIPFDFVAGYGEDNDGIELGACERYKIPEFKNSGAEFLVRVHGSSMYPKYSSGDILACKKIHGDITFFQWGKVYVIDSVQGQLVKRVFEHEDVEMVWLFSENKEKYPKFAIPKSDIRSLSIVLGVVRME